MTEAMKVYSETRRAPAGALGEVEEVVWMQHAPDAFCSVTA